MSKNVSCGNFPKVSWSAIRFVLQWLPCVGCTYVLLVGAGGGGASSTIVGDTIRAKRIVLEDAEGRDLGVWGADSSYGGSVVLTFNESFNKPDSSRITLRASDGGAQVFLDGESRSGALELRTDIEGGEVLLYLPCPGANASCHVKSAVARLKASGGQGRLKLIKELTVDEDGSHSHGSATLFEAP